VKASPKLSRVAPPTINASWLIPSRILVTYKTGFGLDDWIYCTLYIVLGTARNYSAMAIRHTSQFTVTHALQFSAFTSRILATDLSQSRCNFKSHMKSSWHTLIPFLSFLQLPIPKTRIDYSRLLFYPPPRLLCPFITPRHGPHGKHRLLLTIKRVYNSVALQ
jgi:hypothetical protein